MFFYPWPYIEGLTMAEANNELAFIGTGMYGKPMPKQDGAPIRWIHAVEIRFQIGQIDREIQLHRQAPGDVLGEGRSPANTASGPM